MSDTENVSEIDFVKLLKVIWQGKRLVIIAGFIGGILFALYSLLMPSKYTVTTTMIPHSSSSTGIGSNLGGLASLAGVNLSSLEEESSEIPPAIYPQIINSVSFRKELMKTMVYSSNLDSAITYFDYTYNYSGFNLSRFFKGIRNGSGAEEFQVNLEASEGMIIVTQKESEILKSLEERLALEVDKKNGIVSIAATMPEGYMAAQMVVKARQLLQEAITEFRIQKAKEELEYTQRLYDDKKVEFEVVQQEFATFRDNNRDLSSAVALNELQKLESRYDLAMNIYTELAGSLEASKIKVSKETPSFTIIDEATVPLLRTSPKRARMTIIGGIMGGFIGLGIVFFRLLRSSVLEKW